MIENFNMDSTFNICTISFFLMIVSSARAQNGVFDVRKYGSVSNGEITQVRAYKIAQLRHDYFLYQKKIRHDYFQFK